MKEKRSKLQKDMVHLEVDMQPFSESYFSLMANSKLAF